ncbi:MAG TPA: SGNH/GDSL hydrolase family protein [Lacunisphaera sp.]|nr:SGNH/GDSL hydrolase family protein [Lacunisphaera sp.]
MARSCLRPRPLLALGLGLVLRIAAAADPAHWAGEIDALTRDDAAHPPPPHGIVFVGSSSIRFWTTLAEDFPGRPVIRRGFGGSELADSVFYFDRIVLPYHPATVVLYAGDNDIAAGKSPEAVAHDFQAFVARLHAALPGTRLLYLAMKPSPSRWRLHEQYERANRLIADQCAADPRLAFVDVWPAMLDAQGQPRPELFRPDLLHLKPAGYAIWVRLLTPLLPP